MHASPFRLRQSGQHFADKADITKDNFLNENIDISEICSWVYNQQEAMVGLDNGLASI